MHPTASFRSRVTIPFLPTLLFHVVYLAVPMLLSASRRCTKIPTSGSYVPRLVPTTISLSKSPSLLLDYCRSQCRSARTGGYVGVDTSVSPPKVVSILRFRCGNACRSRRPRSHRRVEVAVQPSSWPSIGASGSISYAPGRSCVVVVWSILRFCEAASYSCNIVPSTKSDFFIQVFSSSEYPFHLT